MTIETTKHIYDKLSDYDLLWIFQTDNKKRLWGVLDNKVYTDNELENLFGKYNMIEEPKRVKTYTKGIAKIDSLDSLKWLDEKAPENRQLYEKIETSNIYKDSQKK